MITYSYLSKKETEIILEGIRCGWSVVQGPRTSLCLRKEGFEILIHDKNVAVAHKGKYICHIPHEAFFFSWKKHGKYANDSFSYWDGAKHPYNYMGQIVGPGAVFTVKPDNNLGVTVEVMLPSESGANAILAGYEQPEEIPHA